MKATPIPQRSRDLVKSRDRLRCARCQMSAPNGHWHHRRSRSVRDDHMHCPCNGIWLCPTCHEWVHHNPSKARWVGLILERSCAEPFSRPVKTPLGWMQPDCEGGVVWA